MKFAVSLFKPTADTAPAKATAKVRNTPKWELEGIKVVKYMRHPNCIFCGLKDLGKEASERPTEKHMVSCKDRKLTPKPFSEFNGVRSERTGAFIGEIAPISLRVPVRLIRRIEVPILDESGIPTGEKETRFLCSYKWKSVMVHDWVWNGQEWQPWFRQGDLITAKEQVAPPVITEPAAEQTAEQRIYAERWVNYFSTK